MSKHSEICYREMIYNREKKVKHVPLLSNTSVSMLASEKIDTPKYNRSSLKKAIVHIGLGHFHRAHMCMYLHELLQRNLTDWGVHEVDIIPVSPEFEEAISAQDYLYSLLSKDPSGRQKLKIIGCILGYDNATDNPAKVIDRLASNETKLITLTITEKGYCYDDQEHKLDWSHQGIIHDLSSDEAPVTAIGYLAASFKKRIELNGESVTIMSCDNILANTTILKTCMLEFCSKKFPDILTWIEEHVSFVCTMVDRITPQTTPADLEEIPETYGFQDLWAVHCEEFSQWVIENTYSSRLPDFSRVGATITADVHVYELMKIRLLNGSHSALAYIAYLLGYRKVDEAICDPDLSRFIRNHYMEEITLTLKPIEGVDFSEYKDTLISRFTNANISDSIMRLAQDGSKKIANAIVPPLIETYSRRSSNYAILFALAAWVRFLQGKDEYGTPILIEDSKVKVLQEAAILASQDPRSFFGIIGVAGLSDSNWLDLTQKFKTYLQVIESRGMRDALLDFLA
jgi:mannitol 2-dehydrogenase